MRHSSIIALAAATAISLAAFHSDTLAQSPDPFYAGKQVSCPRDLLDKSLWSREGHKLEACEGRGGVSLRRR